MYVLSGIRTRDPSNLAPADLNVGGAAIVIGTNTFFEHNFITQQLKLC
jgi:hypothetical protein